MVQVEAVHPVPVVQLSQPLPQPQFSDWPVIMTDDKGQQVSCSRVVSCRSYKNLTLLSVQRAAALVSFPRGSIIMIVRARLDSMHV